MKITKAMIDAVMRLHPDREPIVLDEHTVRELLTAALKANAYEHMANWQNRRAFT